MTKKQALLSGSDRKVMMTPVNLMHWINSSSFLFPFRKQLSVWNSSSSSISASQRHVMWVLFAWPNLLTVRQHSMLSVGIFTRAATIWPWKKCVRPSSKYFVTEYFTTLSNYLKAMLLIDTVSILSGMRQTWLTLQLPFSQWLLADLSRPVLRMAVVVEGDLVIFPDLLMHLHNCLLCI